MADLSKSDVKPMKKSATEYMREFFNVGKVKKAFRLGADLFNVVHPVLENQTPVNIAKAVFGVGKVIVDDLEFWPDDYFDDSWDTPFPTDFTKLILNSLANRPYKTLKTSDESSIIHIVTLEDVKVGYTLNTKNNYVERIYAEADKVDRTRELIKIELWKSLKNDNVVLRHVKRPRSNDYDSSSVALELDDAFNPMPSKRAEEYSRYLRKCVDAGVSRSVMLYGPPGTGKSTMARTIVERLGMKSFRIRVEDIGQFDTNTVFEAIDMFEPDAVILDDFDRSHDQTSLLETLEFFQRHVKLVIATVNNKKRLDQAILRPGRFDELVQIKQMDDDVVRSVLGEEYKDAYDVVHEWPIAFIQEYVKRLRFMTSEEAEQSVKELASRVKGLSSYDDADDDEDGLIQPLLDAVRPKKKKTYSNFSNFIEEFEKRNKKIKKRASKSKKMSETMSVLDSHGRIKRKKRVQFAR